MLRSEQHGLLISSLPGCHAGLNVVGRIEDPGFLEGGDFFAAGEDLALVGIGLRSNIEACQQLMDKDILGCQRFAVVHDMYDQNQVHPLTSQTASPLDR